MNYVPSISDLTENSFTIISGHGYPQYYNIIKNAYLDIDRLGNIDYLLICIDAEILSYEEKLNEVNNFIQNECHNVNCETIVVIQNNCIESWLMGNKRISISNARNPELIRYRNHYNVNNLDPEGLVLIDERTIGRFTYRYLKLMLQENGLRYSKKNVTCVNTKEYFESLVERYNDDNHIRSFGIFFNKVTGMTQ